MKFEYVPLSANIHNPHAKGGQHHASGFAFTNQNGRTIGTFTTTFRGTKSWIRVTAKRMTRYQRIRENQYPPDF